jgi:hypothetical protein
MRYLLLSVALLLSSCAIRSAHTIRIDPAFTDVEEAAILEAIARWVEAIPELETEVLTGSDVDTAHMNILRMTEAKYNDDGMIVLGEANRTRMWLWPGLVSDLTFQNVALHEFGHYFGASHLGPEGNVMYPYVAPDMCINAHDIEAVCVGKREGRCLETHPECADDRR